ncbi:hypothetical protein Vau01_037180 [Virgisporangium aurantiacum]|uniref:Uncharacterized protein n=1 Tax=Virgisporangium aurantiacum TaxID=175570 RepID=A0A8J4E1P9_9ACTN|nr:hypothetical protein Vau01_037180 [Virgisporangium aurantiacum]
MHPEGAAWCDGRDPEGKARHAFPDASAGLTNAGTHGAGNGLVAPVSEPTAPTVLDVNGPPQGHRIIRLVATL